MNPCNICKPNCIPLAHRLQTTTLTKPFRGSFFIISHSQPNDHTYLWILTPTRSHCHQYSWILTTAYSMQVSNKQSDYSNRKQPSQRQGLNLLAREVCIPLQLFIFSAVKQTDSRQHKCRIDWNAQRHGKCFFSILPHIFCPRRRRSASLNISKHNKNFRLQ